MSNSRRLHPLAAFLNVIKRIRELFFPLVALVFFGGKNSGWDFYYIAVSGAAIFIILLSGVLSWLRFTYRLEDGELRIEYGVFVKKKRYIPFEKIQSLDALEGLLHRPLGLVRLKIETAGISGGMEAEGMLAAISKSEAAEIQTAFVSYKNPFTRGPAESTAELENTPIYKISASELLLLGTTSGGAGVVLSAAFAFMLQLEQLIPYEKVFRGFEKAAASGIFLISIIILFALLIAWVIAMISTMLKYANFTVLRDQKDLIITRGLLEKRRMTIPIDRIQSVRVKENILRQLFGYATVYVDSAGGSIKEVESAQVMLIPFVKKQKIQALVSDHLENYKIHHTFNGAPKRALKRYIGRSLFYTVPVVVLSLIYWKPWGYLSVFLLAAGTWWAYLKYKDAGWQMDQSQLSLRYRRINRNTVYLRKSKIQSLSASESYFQKHKDLSSLSVFIKSGAGPFEARVTDLEAGEVQEIYSWYSRSR